MKEFLLTVAGLPPPKDGGNSIFSERHRNHGRVVDLLRTAGHALIGTEWNPRVEGHIGLELVVVETQVGFRPDGLNLLGGVADVLQANRRGVGLSHLGDLAEVSLFYDDVQVREGRYSVEAGDAPHYRVRVWLL